MISQVNTGVILIIVLLQINISLLANVLLPFDAIDRYEVSEIRLTNIGQFAQKRKARPNIPEHYHTGIDIKRPGNNYDCEYIYPVAAGIVISKRTDEAYANLIIEHNINGFKVWSLYEHIAGIKVKTGDRVEPSKPIARFMNKDELNRYGWQFDHFHLEIIKVKPQPIQSAAKTPERFFNSYTLTCYTLQDLHKYYIDPVEFLKNKGLKR